MKVELVEISTEHKNTSERCVQLVSIRCTRRRLEEYFPVDPTLRSKETAAMSKRKADEAFGDDADANDSPSWAEDLPDGVTRQIETTLACPKSVTAMEATCKSWRKILQKTDVSYWKPRALERFPRLSVMCKARERKMAGNASSSSSSSSSGVIGGTALGSWKKLYWRQLQAEHRPKEISQLPTKPLTKPLTSIDDYAFTVEFRLEGKMLFEETFTAPFDTARREIVGPTLWSYQFPEDREDDSVNVPLDPELASRLGSIDSKDPFSDEASDEIWDDVTVDVIVHRLSDLASVKLLEHNTLLENHMDGAFMVWEMKRLSCRACFVKEGRSSDKGGINLFAPELEVALYARTGELTLGFFDESNWASDMTEQEVLRYLEVQCPWPTTG